MSEEEKIKISVNDEDIQNLINCYEKDIEYIKQLEKENKQLKDNWNKLKKELKEKLMKYFNINSNCDYYILTRCKSAFGYGTMTFDDFQEFDEEIIDDIVNYLVGDSNE